MSNYSSIKSSVTSAIKTNGNNEITGAVLQSTLLAIINSLGDGFIYKGIATSSTSPGTPDQNVFYVGGPGTYSNFGTPSKTVNEGYLGFFKYNGSWSFETVQVGDANAVKYIVQTLTNSQKEQARANIGAGTYTKPNTGIPASDMESAVQTSLGKADTAYQKPNTGIPSSDMASAVQTSLGKADSAYQKPPSGIPANDLAGGVIPTISTDISADAASNTKTTSPKAVKTYVDAHSGDGAVKYTQQQILTTEQKEQARDNIDAASITELNQLETEVHHLSGKYYGVFTSSSLLPEGDAVGYAFVGPASPYAIWNFDGTDWEDTGSVAQAIYGEPGVGLQTVTSLQDGTVVLTLTNGDTVTMDLNHNHPQYPKYVLCETLSDYNAIATKDAATLYLIPGEAVYLGDVLIVRSGSPLPYTPVSYIETDGTAYIDTGIKGNAPKSSEMKLTPLSEGAFTTHLGARDGNNRFLLVCQWGNAGGYAYDSYIAYGYGPGANPGLSMAATLSNHTPIVVRTKVDAGSQYFGIKQDGESSYTDATGANASTVTTARNIYIFASNQDGAVAQHASNGVKVYYCKIFSDTNFTTPVFDGVPCVYNNEYGLWDKVSDTFFGNAAGSGAFTGPLI